MPATTRPLLALTAWDPMSRDVATISQDTPLRAAAELFFRRQMGEAAVVDSAQEDYPMMDINALINRIDQEIAAEVGRQKAAWAELVQVSRERGLRLQRYETEAKRIIDLV